MVYFRSIFTLMDTQQLACLNLPPTEWTARSPHLGLFDSVRGWFKFKWISLSKESPPES